MQNNETARLFEITRIEMAGTRNNAEIAKSNCMLGGVSMDGTAIIKTNRDVELTPVENASTDWRSILGRYRWVVSVKETTSNAVSYTHLRAHET